MFLSHILAILCGVAVIPLIFVANSPSLWVRTLGAVGLVLMFYGAYRLSSIRWIWIGQTPDQMRVSLLNINLQIKELDGVIFDHKPSAHPLTEGQRQRINAQRRKAYARRKRLEAKISDYSRASQRGG